MASRELSHYVALTANQHGDITGWNDACTALFAREAPSTLGTPVAGLLAEASRPAFHACWAESSTRCDLSQVHILRGDGSEHPAELLLSPAFNDAGVLAGCVLLFMAEPDNSETALVGRMPLSTVIDVLPGTFYVLRQDGSFVLWNKTLEQVVSMSSQEMTHANALDMFDLAEKRIIAEKIRDVFNRNVPVFIEANYLDKFGRGTPFLLCGARIEVHGRHYLCGMGLDITQRRHQEENLRLRERALHATSNGLVITRCAGDDNPIEYANPAFERITGYSADEVVGRDARFMGEPDLDKAERAQLREAIRERREVNVILRNRRKDGEIFWNDLTVTPVVDGRGKVTHFIGVINDITAIKKHTADLEHEVNHDALTGLANRNLLWDRLEQAIHLAQRNKTLVATILIDLNGFKQINDTYGHEAGDAVLIVVAKRLQSSVRESDTVARLAGDEFVLVLANQPSLRYTLRMIERVRVSLNRPVTVKNIEIEVGGSMGVAVYPHDGMGALELVRSADVAMYHAKATKRNEVHFFSSDMKSTTEAKQKMEDDMHAAIDANELFLLYQPKVCLRSGRIQGLEALLRWRHPQQGVMLPSAFLSEAEENGMIIPFGMHVLEEACRFMRRLRDAGRPDLPVSINVSYREYARPHYVADLGAALRSSGMAPELLELELREAGLNTNHHLGLEVLSQLKEIGVARSVDAFGDGMSDLSFLQKLPLSHLKLARRAVHQISADAGSGALAKTLIDVGHNLGLPVIAKGVETRMQMDFLKASQCDEIQGLYFSEPLTEQALGELLALSTPA
ncbi:MAG: EAL domain-containing protein [Pseudomonadota bacterium]